MAQIIYVTKRSLSERFIVSPENTFNTLKFKLTWSIVAHNQVADGSPVVVRDSAATNGEGVAPDDLGVVAGIHGKSKKIPAVKWHNYCLATINFLVTGCFYNRSHIYDDHKLKWVNSNV
jgi:hypothetical protein